MATKRRLKSLEDVRRYLAHLIHEIEGKRLDASIGGRLGYLASILMRAIEGGDLEARLQKLEERIGK